MGVYDGSTFHQGDGNTPPPHPAPPSSSCTTLSTVGNGLAASSSVSSSSSASIVGNSSSVLATSLGSSGSVLPSSSAVLASDSAGGVNSLVRECYWWLLPLFRLISCGSMRFYGVLNYCLRFLAARRSVICSSLSLQFASIWVFWLLSCICSRYPSLCLIISSFSLGFADC